MSEEIWGTLYSTSTSGNTCMNIAHYYNQKIDSNTMDRLYLDFLM